MKYLVALCTVFILSGSTIAQTVTPRPMPKNSEELTQKLNPMPDIAIVSLSVRQVKGSNGQSKLDIYYTLKNIGNAKVAQGDIALDGIATEDRFKQQATNANVWRPGCGATAGLSYQYIMPGQELSGVFHCSLTFDPATRPVYRLDAKLSGKDWNTTNNMQISYITFQ